jgi:serine/threonine protein kinase
LSELEVKFMACQLVKGIRYLHDRDMAHRGEFVSTQ